MAQVGADLLKKLGLTVDDQAMDAATMFQRRSNREPLGMLPGFVKFCGVPKA
jgi:hypothetical protein